MSEKKHDAEGTARTEAYLGSIGVPRIEYVAELRSPFARPPVIGDAETLRAQVAAMKLRALAAHYAIWHAMNGRPGDAIRALQDDGAIHQAVHAIIAVETESVSVPEEWRAHVAQQDRRIAALEAELLCEREEAARWRAVAQSLAAPSRGSSRGSEASARAADHESTTKIEAGDRDRTDDIQLGKQAAVQDEPSGATEIEAPREREGGDR